MALKKSSHQVCVAAWCQVCQWVPGVVFYSDCHHDSSLSLFFYCHPLAQTFSLSLYNVAFQATVFQMSEPTLLISFCSSQDVLWMWATVEMDWGLEVCRSFHLDRSFRQFLREVDTAFSWKDCRYWSCSHSKYGPISSPRVSADCGRPGPLTSKVGPVFAPFISLRSFENR